MSKNKRAVILAGGKGTRLKPYTAIFPKPLVPVGEQPILEIIIKQLIKHGFNHITITVNHLAELIETFFGDGSKWNIKIDYSLEDKPLSTMGPLKLIKDLPKNFLIMNGDVLTDLDYDIFYNDHIEENSLFTISSFQRIQKIDYGVLNTKSGRTLLSFDEKPTIPFEVSMGIYMANVRILDHIPDDIAFGFDHLMHKMIDEKEYPVVKLHKGYWLDIGRPSDYDKACNDINNLLDD
jgi:NDP-mannose synthase